MSILNFDTLPKEVKIVEVGPRDGLQNEKLPIPTELKVNFINDLKSAGLKEIEITSFVKPDKIPQMNDALQLVKELGELSAHDIALVPNLKGLENALKANVKSIAIFTATSDEFNLKNINANVSDSKKRLEPVLLEAKKNKLNIRGYISTVFGCPYQKKIDNHILIDLISWMNDFNVDEISLGDTIGVAKPKQVSETLERVKESGHSLDNIALHFHNTFGMALTNVLVGLNHGIHIYDSSAGGLGGCPYAKGATGNVATEDLVILFDSLGIKTGVDLDKLKKSSKEILNLLGKKSQATTIKES